MAPFAAIVFAIILACCQASTVGKRDGTPPNVIWIFADDYGFNDVGFKDSSIQTPNIDELANNGIIFNNAYVAPQCSPSRSSLLSGRYPYTTAMQHSVILDNRPDCMGLDYKFLPEYLQDLGYETHAIGKWHLGYCRWECTPTYRGFDTFYGGYSGEAYYENHTTAGMAFDWHDGEEIDASANGVHSQTLIQTRALEIIDGMDGSKPFFFYVAFHNVHAPLEPIKEFEDLYADIDATDARKKYLGLVSGMDDVIGQLVKGLKDKGLYDNTVILFSSDNGGDTGEGNNYPYRGTKASLWEGGCRAISFSHSPLLTQSGISVDGIMHVTDWLPTIVSIAGGTPPPEVDGLDQTDMVMNGGDSVRDRFIYNLDREYEIGQPTYGEMAARNARYKLIWGFSGQCDGVGLDGATQIFNLPQYTDAVDEHAGMMTGGDKRGVRGDESEEEEEEEEEERMRRGGPYEWSPNQLYYLVTYVSMTMVTEDQFATGTGQMMLFDLQEDPTESTNIVDSEDPDVVAAKEELIKMIQDAYNGGTYKHQNLVGQKPSTAYAVKEGALYPGWCDDLFPVSE